MFDALFGRKPAAPCILVAQLNARLQPMHRGEFFDDPLEAWLSDQGLGEICGGGTLQASSGEIERCDIEIELPALKGGHVERIIQQLETLGVPRGSTLINETSGETLPLGRAAGLAVYLNGTDLPEETYQTCDSNHVYAEFGRLLGDEGRVLSSWQGPTETAFYVYGRDAGEMQRRLADFIASYPLCARCRVVAIA